jgi:hypothetical protein
MDIERKPKSLYEVFLQAGIQSGIERSAEIARRWESGEIRFPKGVFRFKTPGEANKWENEVLAGKNPLK